MRRSIPQLTASLAVLIALAARAAAPSVEVTIEGLEGGPLNNVRALLTLEQRREALSLSETQIRRFHRQAPAEIRTALEPFGFYRPEIDATLERGPEGTWRARYVVSPGLPVRVATFDLRITGAGADDPAFRALTAELPIGEGDILHHGHYKRTKKLLHDRAAERGYFDAKLETHRVAVDLEAYEARIRLHFDTGPRYRFGEVTFTDNEFNERFLERYVPFKRGDPYITEQLLELESALTDSDYFERVEVRPEPEKSENLHIPVTVEVTPRKKQKITVGVGYGTDTGPRARVGIERRRSNQWGHRYGAELATSEISDSATFHYVVPLKKPRTDELRFTAGWAEDRPETSVTETRQLGVVRSRARGHWKESQSITYRHDDFEVGDQTGRTELFMPGMSWTRTKADDLVYPRHGSRVTLDLRGAHEAAGSDVSFLQARLQGKWVRDVWWEDGRVIFRTELGTTEISEFETLPPTVRFFAGGDQSVRGYAFKSLGPEDADGEVVGGEHLIVGSLEYEHWVLEKWGVAAFFDIGNAFDDFSRREGLKRGAGLGLRWRSPIGPVRLDFAAALDRPGDPIRVHFVIGPEL